MSRPVPTKRKVHAKPVATPMSKPSSVETNGASSPMTNPDEVRGLIVKRAYERYVEASCRAVQKILRHASSGEAAAR